MTMQVYTCECLDKHWRIWNYKWDDPVDLSELTKNLFDVILKSKFENPLVYMKNNNFQQRRRGFWNLNVVSFSGK